MTARRLSMSTLTRADGTVSVSLANIVIVALVGAALVFVAGLAQSETLHDAAHDVRHAVGFPCH
nr:CbtB domain-containing protein [Pseudogemmobacter humi]